MGMIARIREKKTLKIGHPRKLDPTKISRYMYPGLPNEKLMLKNAKKSHGHKANAHRNIY
jgi:hypothetical protein